MKDRDDARRYRWIVEQGVVEIDGAGWVLRLAIRGAPSLETLEQAIDAAMAADSTRTNKG